MLEGIYKEFFVTNGPGWLTLTIRLFGTVVLCGVIGLEREFHKNTAGLRTNILVGLASAAFALIALTIIETPVANESAVKMDPLRLVDSVTSGVAFLAAGLVVFTKGKIRGLTTGASLWLSASIGLSVGLGYWQIAIMVTLLGYVVLTALNAVKSKIGVEEE
ncbi:MgtC/SapB family protein [Maritalea sp.]|uniref:MgtC/SapB family protein n=1 Tax=Maritalea sp. TaxID=2003361 RepID=UPI003EF4D09F